MKKKTKKIHRIVKMVLSSEYELSARLERKRHFIMDLVGKIDCDVFNDPSTGETYPYTEAAIVFRAFHEAFWKAGLTIFPIATVDFKPQIIFLGRMVIVTGYYAICDIDTGYYRIGWGIGMGSNAIWSSNSAQTLAMKQFLLNAGLCYWPRPPGTQDITALEITEYHKGELTDLANKIGIVEKEIDELMGKEAKRMKDNHILKGQKNGTTRTQNATANPADSRDGKHISH